MCTSSWIAVAILQLVEAEIVRRHSLCNSDTTPVDNSFSEGEAGKLEFSSKHGGGFIFSVLVSEGAPNLRASRRVLA